MALTDKQVDLIIGGCIALAGTVIGSTLVGATSRVRAWWDHKRQLKVKLQHSGRLIMNSDEPVRISDELFKLRVLIDDNLELLDRAEIRLFFDTWLNEPMLLRGHLHPQLTSTTCQDTVALIKKQVAGLIH